MILEAPQRVNVADPLTLKTQRQEGMKGKDTGEGRPGCVGRRVHVATHKTYTKINC